MMLYKLKLAACFGIPEASGTCIISLVVAVAFAVLFRPKKEQK